MKIDLSEEEMANARLNTLTNEVLRHLEEKAQLAAANAHLMRRVEELEAAAAESGSPVAPAATDAPGKGA